MVHVELLSSIETDFFIQALSRFVARRGKVREIRTDSGTTCEGAERELRKGFEEMEQKMIGNFLVAKGCDYIL